MYKSSCKGVMSGTPLVYTGGGGSTNFRFLEWLGTSLDIYILLIINKLQADIYILLIINKLQADIYIINN